MEQWPSAPVHQPCSARWASALVVFGLLASPVRTLASVADGGAPADASPYRAEDASSLTPRDAARDDTADGLDFTGTPTPPPQEAVLPPASAVTVTGPKRPLPHYDGRPAVPGTPGEMFVWGPRVVLFPLHVIAEYALRRPLVGVITFGEKHYLWPRVYDLFTWNDGRAGAYPIFDFQVALKSSAGVSLFARDFVAEGNDFHTSAAVADQGVVDLRVRDHLSLWPHQQGGVYVRASWVRRPDGMYFGESGLTRQSDLTYYFYDDRSMEVGLDGNLGGMNRIAVELGVRDIDFSTDTRSPDRVSVTTRFGGPTGPPLPAGLGGYGLLRPRIGLVLDSRDPVYEHPTGTGVRLETDASYGRSFSDTPLAFFGWGASLAGFWDISGVNHVLALEIVSRFVEPISGGPIPFTELPTIGGNELLRGFYSGRFRNQGVFAATLQYRYPIWIYVDSEIFAGVGNAFPGHLQGLGPGTLYLSYGCGLRTTFSREVSFIATAAAGTRRFDDPSFRTLDTTRFVFGAIHGF
jgi:hypothetical protein